MRQVRAASGLLHGSGSAETPVTALVLPGSGHTGQGHDRVAYQSSYTESD